MRTFRAFLPLDVSLFLRPSPRRKPSAAARIAYSIVDPCTHTKESFSRTLSSFSLPSPPQPTQRRRPPGRQTPDDDATDALADLR